MPEKLPRKLFCRLDPDLNARWLAHVDRLRLERDPSLPESDFVREALEAAMLASEAKS